MRHHRARAIRGILASAFVVLVAGYPAGAAGPTVSGPPDLPPQYTTGDITGDGKIGTDDLDKLERNLGKTAGSPGWPAVAAADLNGDNALTVADLALMSQEIIYDDGTFKLVEADALQMQAAMNAGVVTSVQLTKAYLARIAAYDRTVQPGATQPLNSIITTSSVALAAAAESDAARAANHGPRSLLDGIPIVLKDNYDTKDMPTTAGCSCWAQNQTTDDSFMAKGLRAAHAIVLAKASMDEFAINTSSTFSFGSPAGSSLNVYSPYRPTGTSSTSGGSSGGTGASVAANLAALGFGTDTGGSIRVPSSFNQLVGLRPTVGLTSRSGIVPLALSQDVGGPLARSVTDLAIALDAVVGTDPDDPATAASSANVPATYTAFLDKNGLQGKRIGYDPSMVGTNVTVVRLFNQLKADLEAQGATVVPITIPTLSTILGEASGSTNEFNHDLNNYVAAHLNPAVPYRSLTQIANSGGLFVPGRGAPNGTYASRGAITPATYATWIASHGANIASFRATVTGTMDANSLDAVMYPTGSPFGSVGSNLRLSPNTGLPALTVPMGLAAGTENFAGIGGANIELVGRSYAEPTLISIGYAYEQATKHRTTPSLYPALAGDVFPGPGDDDDPAGNGAVTVARSVANASKGQQFTVTVRQDAAALFAFDLTVGYDAKAFSLVGTAVGPSGTSYTETVSQRGEGGRHQARHVSRVAGPDRARHADLQGHEGGLDGGHHRHRPRHGRPERNGRLDAQVRDAGQDRAAHDRRRPDGLPPARHDGHRPDHRQGGRLARARRRQRHRPDHRRGGRLAPAPGRHRHRPRSRPTEPPGSASAAPRSPAPSPRRPPPASSRSATPEATATETRSRAASRWPTTRAASSSTTTTSWAR